MTDRTYHRGTKDTKAHQESFRAALCVFVSRWWVNSKSFWRLSKTYATQRGMTNQWLEVQGLISIKDLWVTMHYPFTRRALLHGEQGTIEFTFRIRGDWLDHSCLFYPASGEPQDLGIAHCYPHQAALNHMVDVISGNTQDSPLSIQHAIASLRVAVVVNQSLGQEHSTVHLSSSA